MYRKDPVEFAWHYWLNHRNKSPHKVLEDWQSSDWQPDDFQHFLYDTLFLANKRHIENNKVIDLGCYIGISSYSIMEVGASYVTGIDVQSEAVNFAPMVLEKGGYTNCNFITTDLDKSQTLPADHAVVVASFFIKQILDHYRLFEQIKNSDCKTFILWDRIDNKEQLDHWNSDQPDVKLRKGNLTGTTQLVDKGTPNKKYILDTFKDWTLTRDGIFEDTHERLSTQDLIDPYCWTMTLTRD